MSGRMALVGGVVLVIVLVAGWFAVSALMSAGGAGGQTPDGPAVELTQEAARQYQNGGRTPARPRFAGRQTPNRPPARRQAPATRPPGELTQDTYDALKNGMSFEEVIDLVGPPRMRISRTGARFEMYRWTNENGDSYMAKFEDGSLIQKTRLNLEEEPASRGGKGITMQKYAQLEEGMSPDRVSQILGFKPKLLNTNHTSVDYYEWRDAAGANFTAKFVHNRLDSMTGLIAPAGPDEPPPPERQNQSKVDTLENPPQDQPLRGSLTPEEIEAFVAARRPSAQMLESSAEQENEAPRPARQVNRISSPQPAQQRPRVAVVGGRDSGEEQEPFADRSYKPRVKLPEFRHSLRRGVYEIKVVNESEATAEVGIRSGKRGEDVTVPPGGDRSFKVDRGQYALHYLYKDDPYTLYSGDTISIDGQNLADLEVRLENGNYTINTLHEIFVPNASPLED